MLRNAGRTVAARFMSVSIRRALPVLLLCGFGTHALAQAIPLTGGTYTQDFDTLANTAGSTTNSTLPTGWLISETGGGARDNEQYAVDTGASNTGDIFSYGAAGSTERALGSLRSGTLVASYGACFSNSTGSTLASFDVAYTGEQWRLGTAARTDQIDFQYSLDATSLTTGTWVDVNALDFITPNTATTGAKDGNAAGNRTALSATVGSLAIANGSTFCLRWNDADATSADDGLAIDDVSVTVGGGSGLPVLTMLDAAAPEGDGPGTSFSAGVLLQLSAPAGPGGVSWEATATGGTATPFGDGSDPDYDFGEQTWSGVIPEGQSAISFVVPVVGDTRPEADETFIVTVFNVVGAVVADGIGVGTIQNDDFTIVPIAEIQGAGLDSPLTGSTVTTVGVVTAQKFNNGFFLQTADAETDLNPATSEGIFVFTNTAPPASAAVGNRVRVTGTVAEFTPTTNLNQLSITQLTQVASIQVLSSGNALPTPVALTSTDFGPTALPGTAEKYEGMRVSVANGLVVAASDGNISEGPATSTTTGVFHVVVPGVDRPFREAGIGVLDVFPIPGGKTPPRFDTNQERLMVRSRGQVGATAIALDAEAQVSNLVGVLDYFSGTWALLPDAGSPPTVNGGKAGTPVADAAYEDVTIGAFNLLRFFDEINDSNGAPTLQVAALDKRLTKTSLAICDYVKAPDILGVVEVENLRVLGLLADRINATCARAPQYVPYLVQGNDPGGINVGFLVSTRSLGSVNRVDVVEVVQYGKDTLFTNPDASTSLLNDRPPLMLRAVVNQDNGATYPVTVFVNHLRSLNGIDDSTAGSNGWPTESDRVRNKRAQQALYLANLVEARQQANPDEHIVLLGDFNAFEFSDGYADVMGIIRGDEAPEAEVLTFTASPVTAPLIDGSELITEAAERYSYVFAGNAQTLDHVIVNEALVMDTGSLSVDHARINADFGVHHYGVAGIALRTSDHDPVRLAIGVQDFRTADLSITAGATPASVAGGGIATFTATVDNDGPNEAIAPSVALVFDALVSVTVSEPVGWSCGTPVQAGGTTSVSCTTSSLAVGAQASFSAAVTVPLQASPSTLQMDAAVLSQTNDRNAADDSATASVAVEAALPFADLGLRLIGGPVGSVPAGYITTTVVQVRNGGPNASSQPTVTFTGNVGPGSASVLPPAGWNCVAGSLGNGNFNTVCTATGSLASGARVNFTLNVTAPNVQGQPTLTYRATVGSTTTSDPLPVNNSATRTLQVEGAPATIPGQSGRG
ncbi:endonuclease/exonuclease/phosphatase family protein [Arenimonas sp.]|uniref:endonuclease/exonuclease/phosphatase family protein n=1 Tax=Arenimonas sp. TaxID=1872635 RepID=UPI002E3612A7|nr:endonuclease/exonuclease/phosphatase family protein [Arenimonas sp.]HEX4853566.1 endonuclease/exonuclease/phosphatase family protein [Arenimonas sp.]